MSEITTIAQLSKKGRRALYYVATGVSEYEREASKACLKRLHDIGLVSDADRAAARLTELGARLAVQAGWSFMGSAHQIRIDALLQRRDPEPAPLIVAEPAPVAPAVEARPFLKYAGGKGRLMADIKGAMPENFGRLFVPFVGAGSLPLSMAGRVAYISDANTHLIRCYIAIRDNVEDLIFALGDFANDEQRFYEVRDAFNSGYGDDLWKAAAFIYMNRVGFNGVCRFNRKGEFNGTFGDGKPKAICDADNLRACATALRGMRIEADDFRAVEHIARPGDAVWFDPPYCEESKTASFTGYWGKWTDQDHADVAALFRRLVARGVHVLASNSETPRARELYAGFEIRQLTRANSVNSKASARGGKPEILVLGGTWTPRGAT
jgi:DNA adenine methylase